MKVSFILLLLFSVHFVCANAIDAIETTDDLEKFISKKIPRKIRKSIFIDNPYPQTATTEMKAFYKVDLDNNGLTDLVINGYGLYAITDSGNNNYKVVIIGSGGFTSYKYTLKNIIDKPIAKVVVRKKSDFNDSVVFPADTLVYKFNRFIKYNPKPEDLSITEIKFSASECFGPCPVFEIEINSDLTVKYNAVKCNKIEGNFTSHIDNASLQEINAIVKYIDPFTLKDKYEVGWTCDQTVTLEIKYSNGKTKIIEDYGAEGTFGLNILYDKLFALRNKLEWQ